MIETIGTIGFVAIFALILFLLSLMAVGSYFELAAEIAEARARKAAAQTQEREVGNGSSVDE